MLASAALGSKQIAANESQPAVRIGDIHYCTLVAMVEGDGLESNGYSVLECRRDGTLSLTGFRKQSSYQLS